MSRDDGEDRKRSKKDKKKKKAEDANKTGLCWLALCRHTQDKDSKLAVDSLPSDKDRKRKREVEPDDALPDVHKEKKKKKRIQDTESTVVPISASEAQAFLEKHSITIYAPPSTPSIPPATSFDQLDIPHGLRAAFDGFKEPTPIQAAAWPWALSGRDVIGIAETGRCVHLHICNGLSSLKWTTISGKTLAFGIPALARLIVAGSPQSTSESGKKPKKSRRTGTVNVLVVAPTRELAIQTHDTLSALGDSFGIASVAVYGGVDKDSQVKALSNSSQDGKSTRIIVGTPGRILDLVNDGTCNLSKYVHSLE